MIPRFANALAWCLLTLSPRSAQSRIGRTIKPSLELSPVQLTTSLRERDGDDSIVDVNEQNHKTASKRRTVALPSDHINNGHRSAANEYPFFAEVWWKGLARGCGGTLIASRWILTAAHCAARFTSEGRVGYPEWRIGSYCYNADNCGAAVQVIGSKRTIIHPQADGSVLKWDYALVELEQASSATPIELDMDGSFYTSLEQGSSVRTIGTGNIDDDGTIPDYLLEADVLFLPLEDCRRFFTTGSQFDESVMCTNGAGLGTCSGDSGGPMMVRNADAPHGYIQIGVTSFGPPLCANHNYPEGSARVGIVSQWIRTHVCPSYISSSEQGEGPHFCPPQSSSSSAPPNEEEQPPADSEDSDDNDDNNDLPVRHMLTPTPVPTSPPVNEKEGGASCESSNNIFFRYQKRKHRKCSKLKGGKKRQKMCNPINSDAFVKCKKECGGCSQ